MDILNPLEHSICLEQPLRTEISAWVQHVPFGMFLIDILRPKVLVELGTHNGISYCGFCQAINKLQISTRCYAVDTWQGDPQAGLYGDQVLFDLRAHHDPLYGSFSRLIQSTFEEALTHFEAGSIDLLHIDGLHTYGAVKSDFESWLPKMSERGVILFHDINVRERDFGVWKLWSELRGRYPNFEMIHGHGLGVLAVGQEQPEQLQKLLRVSTDEQNRIRELFYRLGLSIENVLEINRLTERAKDLSRTVTELQSREQQLLELERLLPVRFARAWSSGGIKGVVQKSLVKLQPNSSRALDDSENTP